MSFPLAAAFVALCSVAAAQTPSGPHLLVLSKRDHTLAIVNPATLKVEARIPVGDDPHEVVASTDGRTAYVSNYGFGAFHTITVVDLVAAKQEKVIDLTPLRGPHGLFFADGKQIETFGNVDLTEAQQVSSDTDFPAPTTRSRKR